MDVVETALPDDESRIIAAAVREALARRRMSRLALADQARISISTLEKALAGRRPFTLATTIRLEEALGTRLRADHAKLQPSPEAGQAPEALGAYSRGSVSGLEGRYLTLRPSFGEPGSIFAYLTDIVWAEEASHLVFKEAERLDAAFTQRGFVTVPYESGHIYLVTNWRGQYRLAVLGRPTIRREIYGLLTTLQQGRGSQLTPTASPLALVPLDPSLPATAIQYGRVSRLDRCFGSYRMHLDRIAQDGFAAFPTHS